jgi:hypothetical protein
MAADKRPRLLLEKSCQTICIRQISALLPLDIYFHLRLNKKTAGTQMPAVDYSETIKF